MILVYVKVLDKALRSYIREKLRQRHNGLEMLVDDMDDLRDFARVPSEKLAILSRMKFSFSAVQAMKF